MQLKKFSQMEKEGMLKYMENTKPGDGEWRLIVSQKDERLVKDKTYIENSLIHETELIISWWMKDQLDVTCYFISLIMRSTCFGH